MLDNEADRISASGGLIDIIADVAAIFYLTETNDDFLRIEQMLGWWKSAQEIVQDWVSYPTAESSFTALWRTLMANQTIGNVRPSPDYVHRAKAFLLSRLLVDLVRGLDNEAPPMWDTYELGLREKGVPMLELTQRTRPEPMHVPLAAIHYQQAFWSTCHDRRFCVTKKGYFGIVPQQAKVGDVISIFAGAELPFVLRSREDAQSYEVIGRCYIHGVSDGEVWEWNDFKSEDIIIS